MRNITLNNDQSKLVDALTEFWYDQDERYFVLSGQAGVGKTTTLRYFVQSLNESLTHSPHICMSAPTNKAVSVLEQAMGDFGDVTFKTIYSVLGLRMMANGEFKELKDTGVEKVSDFDLLIIDEGSMLNTNVIEYLLKKTQLSDTKIVMVGDKEQLNPVGEASSPIWTKFKVNYELTEVMRHQNAILTFVQSIRANPKPVFESPGKQVKILDEEPFIDRIIADAKAGNFHSGDVKAIAWRNVTVEFLNQLIRENYEKTKSDDLFTVGDRVVFKEPVSTGDRMLASTDEEGTVVDVNITHHSLYPMLTTWAVTVLTDDNVRVKTHIIHEKSESILQKMLDDYKNSKRWDLFWKLKDAFNSISYAYAITSHRSQGSTYQRVYVDAGDIMLNRTLSERTKCLYVACSRASSELVIFP